MTASFSSVHRLSRFQVRAVAAIWLALSCAISAESVSAQTTVAEKPLTVATTQRTPSVAVKLADNGRALLPVVISAEATDREKAAAKTLAAYLSRISGSDFKVETTTKTLTSNTPGIVLGTASRFNQIPDGLKAGDATTREDYLLRSHALGVLLVGVSQLALEHAVWDLLYRLGHRQFFPGATWEVVPNEKNLSLAVDVLEHPDYYARRIWFSFDAMPENRESAAAWNARNRATLGIELNTGHAYEGIIKRNAAQFKTHPEYLTKPGGNKFCVSDPGLQQLVIKDALARFEKNPNLQSISLDPSDGGGWESGACRDSEVYRSVTDRVITLANVVADAVTEKYPDKYIGLYAYNEHSPPPTINVHPRVVVSIATGFIRGGYSMEELLAGWSAKASLLGIREYYSVHAWDRDMPGDARGSNLNYLQRTIPNFHTKKAHFMSAESSDNWGPNGLGYYIASRLLWDVGDAGQVEALKNDFFARAFGPAREPMAEFYRLIDGSNKPLVSADLIGRLYRQLDKASQSTSDAAILARLHDLTLYVRYVELFLEYSQASGGARQAAYESVMRFAWRIRKTHMIHTVALWRDLNYRDKRVKIPAGSGYFVSAAKDPWKSSEPLTNEDIRKFIAEGIENNKLLEFSPVQFSRELVPATPLNLSSGKLGDFNMLRGSQNFYTWVQNPPATISLQATGGLIYNTRGAAEFVLFPAAEAELNSVAQQGVAPDKQAHDVQLKTTFPGLHRINVSDTAAGTTVTWPAGTPMTVESSLATATRFAGGRWTMYFYVPKGTKIVGGYRSNDRGEILDGSGKSVLKFTGKNNPSYWSVPVAPGQDGKLWTLSSISGQVMLMTTPPYLARSAAELLLPREVVAADTAR